jgi:NAD(P)-dependent dehydrogenase (short-subunit alcohol dehydrogenase family)
MARVLVTGSSDGIRLMSGRLLLQAGHEVTLHVRNEERAADLRRDWGGAPTVVIGDLASLEQTRSVAEQATASAPTTRSSTTPVSASAAWPGRPARTATSSRSRSTCWRLTCSSLSLIGRDGSSISAQLGHAPGRDA